MLIFIFLLTAIFIFVIFLYMLYRFTFCHPMSKRPIANQIPATQLYNTHKSKMLKVVHDMDNTPYELIEIKSYDKHRLFGRLYNQSDKKKPLFIFFHGYHGVSAWDGYGFFKLCMEHDFPILMPDIRAHGTSEGSIAFGIKERHDCKQWVDYAIQKFGTDTDIILAGVSMGAVSVLLSTELNLPTNVKAIISDCAFSDSAGMIKSILLQMKLPTALFYKLIRLSAKLFGKFNLEESSATNAVQNMSVPVLFIHGIEDSVVPLHMCEMLYEKCTSPKSKCLMEGADHANCAMTDYETYHNVIMNFLKTVLPL